MRRRHTKLLDDCCHFVEFLRTDIWAVCKPKVNQTPLSKEIFVSESPSIMSCQIERASNSCLSPFTRFKILFYVFIVSVEFPAEQKCDEDCRTDNECSKVNKAAKGMVTYSSVPAISHVATAAITTFCIWNSQPKLR